MPESVEAVEPAVETSAEEAADFAESFDGDATPTPVEPVEAESTEASVAVADKAPVYVQVTEDEHKRLLTSAETVEKIAANLEQRFGSVFGKVGEIQDRLKSLQGNTPAGQPVTLSLEDFKEMKEDFPELAGMTMKAVERIVSRMAGTGTGLGAEQIEQLVSTRLGQLETKQVMDTMDGLNEGWKEVVGLPDASGKAPDTAYRRWLATQPEDYRTKVEATRNPYVLNRAIERFQSESKTPKKLTPKPASSRFADAVTPVGVGGRATASVPETEEAGFEAGFK